MPDYLSRQLFDDIPYLVHAREEHDQFAKTLRDCGVQVLYLEELLKEARLGLLHPVIGGEVDGVEGVREPALRKLCAREARLGVREQEDAPAAGAKARKEGLRRRVRVEILSGGLPEEERKLRGERGGILRGDRRVCGAGLRRVEKQGLEDPEEVNLDVREAHLPAKGGFRLPAEL